jgi:hypothetical protein
MEQMMKYTVEQSGNRKYIVCRVVGEITKENSLEFTMAIDRMSRETGIKNFLTDVRNAQNLLSTIDNYDYVLKDMESMRLQRDVRSAVLASAEDHSHDFVSIVAQNKGYNLRIFRDEKEAIAWLNE